LRPGCGRASALLLDAEDEVADVDLVGLLDHERARDLPTVYVSTIRTLEVDDDELAVLEHDAGVALGHVALGQDDVVALYPANRHLLLVKVEAPLFSAFFGYGYRKHARPLVNDVSAFDGRRSKLPLDALKTLKTLLKVRLMGKLSTAGP